MAIDSFIALLTLAISKMMSMNKSQRVRVTSTFNGDHSDQNEISRLTK